MSAYWDEYWSNAVRKLEKENDDLRVAMCSMATYAAVEDLHNTIATLSACVKNDTALLTKVNAECADQKKTIEMLQAFTAADLKVKTDLLATIHRLEDKLVSTGLSDAAKLNEAFDRNAALDSQLYIQKQATQIAQEAGVQLQIEVSDLKERLHNNFQSTTINRLEDTLRASETKLHLQYEAWEACRMAAAATEDKLDATTTELVKTLNREGRLLKDNKELRACCDHYGKKLTEANKALRACKVDKEHLQNTIRDLDITEKEAWAYATKARKLNADLNDQVMELETAKHSCKDGDVTILEKDRAALDTLNKMLLKNNKELRASINRLENGHVEDAYRNVKDFLQFLADNFEDQTKE